MTSCRNELISRSRHQRADAGEDLRRFLDFHPPHVIAALEIEPKLGVHVEECAKGKGGLSTDRALALDDLVDALAHRILRVQDEMRGLAREILSLPDGLTTDADADTYIAQITQRLARKMAEETTEWSLDGDEEGDDGIYSDAEIQGETDLVRQLIRIVPAGTDRKFDRLVQIISGLQAENPDERFIIFTQYRETLEFLRIELSKIFGADKVATIKGGPLEQKIEAVERFWEENGAKFLISTSAGGEGINLQICRVLFNYDLPWNPMAVEQRIGRIHRFGQKEVSQVYTLVASGTVEERIYSLLWDKLAEIAKAIGKSDPETGQPTEDFRTEILGHIGSNTDYQQLFRKALVDRDYRRTEREIEAMLLQAQQARDALMELTQDLSGFNLERYRRISGQFHLNQLGNWCREAIIRLGGSIVPAGEAGMWTVLTPEGLLQGTTVAPRYDAATFDRDIATRKKRVDLLGIGHPLVDVLLDYLRKAPFPGEVACLTADPADPGTIEARYRITWDLIGSDSPASFVRVRVNGTAIPDELSADPGRLPLRSAADRIVSIPQDARARCEEALSLWISSRKTEYPEGTIPRADLLGVSVTPGR